MITTPASSPKTEFTYHVLKPQKAILPAVIGVLVNIPETATKILRPTLKLRLYMYKEPFEF